jgi:hypothetical protein
MQIKTKTRRSKEQYVLVYLVLVIASFAIGNSPPTDHPTENQDTIDDRNQLQKIRNGLGHRYSGVIISSWDHRFSHFVFGFKPDLAQ